MTPTIGHIDDRGMFHAKKGTLRELVSLFALVGSTVDDAKCAVWNGHEFEVWTCQITSSFLNFNRPQTHELGGNMYYPVDPRIAEIDVLGATIAYPNTTNDGWLFAHATAEEHHELELEVEGLLIAHLTPKILSVQREVSRAGDTTARTLADNKYGAYLEFQVASVAAVESEFRKHSLGHYVRNKGIDNHRMTMIRALQSTLTAFKQRAKSDVILKYQIPSLENDVAALVTKLTETPTIETRWDQEARIAAELKAKQAAQDSQGNGQ